ncbi:hypothetical protein C8R43DRAFT_950567 [Mycena crocata]|nr:hypothetical protein C8R43DRAFT_950567 [Mycena crocata]
MPQNIHSRSAGFKIASSLAKDLGLFDYRYMYMTEDDRQAANYKPNFVAHFIHPLVAAYRMHGAGGCYGCAMLLVIESPYFVKYLRKNDRRLFVHHTREMLKVETLNLSPTAILEWLSIFVMLDIYSKLFHRRVRQISAQTREDVLKWTLRVKNETARCIFTNKQDNASGIGLNKNVIALCDSLMDTLKKRMTWDEITSSSPIFTDRDPDFFRILSIVPSLKLRENSVVAVEQQLIVAKNISGSTGRPPKEYSAASEMMSSSRLILSTTAEVDLQQPFAHALAPERTTAMADQIRLALMEKAGGCMKQSSTCTDLRRPGKAQLRRALDAAVSIKRRINSKAVRQRWEKGQHVANEADAAKRSAQRKVFDLAITRHARRNDGAQVGRIFEAQKKRAELRLEVSETAQFTPARRPIHGFSANRTGDPNQMQPCQLGHGLQSVAKIEPIQIKKPVKMQLAHPRQQDRGHIGEVFSDP